MARVVRGEELVAWQKARVLTREVYAVTRRGVFARDFGLRNQIERAAVSVMSNVAEGFERGKRSEFHQFVCVAKASCGEVRSILYVAMDIGYVNESEFNALHKLVEEISRILGGLRVSLERTKGR